MPFDGIDSFETHPLAKLGAVERLLATEQQWCKGRLRDAHGRHCLVGAIEAVEARQMLQRIILHAAREVSGKRYWRIEFFNDDPRTTHAEVLQVLRRARENIIDGMINELDSQAWHRRWLNSLRGWCSRSAFDTGANIRSSEGGNRPWAAAPAISCRGFETGVNAESDPVKPRALVMETQN